MSRLYLIGSYARDEADAKSDIDIVYDFTTPITFEDLADFIIEVEDTLGKDVDSIPLNKLSLLEKTDILKRGELIYERKGTPVGLYENGK